MFGSWVFYNINDISKMLMSKIHLIVANSAPIQGMFAGVATKLLLLGVMVSPMSWAIDLNAFPGARVIESLQQEQDYELALGPMKNINGNWQPDISLLVTGLLERSIYELPRSRSLEEILANYQKQLKSYKAKPLFVCSGHNCGSSGSWANLHFGQRSLYGLDQTQHYLVYQVEQQHHSQIVVIYLVTRGNKRSYLLVDQISVEGPVDHQLSSQTVETLLASGQRLSLMANTAGDNWVLDDNVIAIVARVMKLSPSIKLVVVASDYRSNNLDKNLEQSKNIAQQAVQQLIKLGADSGRLRAEGIGNLADTEEQGVGVWVFQYQT